jgi:hypothetical protein
MQVVFVGNAEGPGRFKVQKTFIESGSVFRWRSRSSASALGSLLARSTRS